LAGGRDGTADRTRRFATTGGYRTWIGYAPASLTHAGTPVGPHDIGPHLLVEGAPLRAFPKPRQETTIAPALFDRYASRHQLAPDIVIGIARRGSRRRRWPWSGMQLVMFLLGPHSLIGSASAHDRLYFTGLVYNVRRGQLRFAHDSHPP